MVKKKKRNCKKTKQIRLDDKARKATNSVDETGAEKLSQFYGIHPKSKTPRIFQKKNPEEGTKIHVYTTIQDVWSSHE